MIFFADPTEMLQNTIMHSLYNGLKLCTGKPIKVSDSPDFHNINDGFKELFSISHLALCCIWTQTPQKEYCYRHFAVSESEI